MSVEWQIIFLMFIVISTYLSYRTGQRIGIEEGVEGILVHLEKAGFIDVDDNGDITAASATPGNGKNTEK